MSPSESSQHGSFEVAANYKKQVFEDLSEAEMQAEAEQRAQKSGRDVWLVFQDYLHAIPEAEATLAAMSLEEAATYVRANANVKGIDGLLEEAQLVPRTQRRVTKDIEAIKPNPYL